MERLTFVWNFWLSGLCNGFHVIILYQFHPEHESVLSPFVLFLLMFIEHLTVFMLHMKYA